MSDSQSRFPLTSRQIRPFLFPRRGDIPSPGYYSRAYPLCNCSRAFATFSLCHANSRVSRRYNGIIFGRRWCMTVAHRVGGALNQPIYLFIPQSKVRHAFGGVSLSVCYLLSALQFRNVSLFRTRLIVSPTSRDNATRHSHESTIFP